MPEFIFGVIFAGFVLFILLKSGILTIKPFAKK